MRCWDERTETKLIDAHRLWMFLDYDGTLVEFAETPDQIEVNQEIVDLLIRLEQLPGVRATVISGRRLDHIRKLLPVPGVLLAGTYGLEFHSFEGEDIHRLDYENVRPLLENLKPQLQDLIEGKKGYFLEDKGWSLAIHARYATEKDSEQVLKSAHQILNQVSLDEDLVILGGQKFLEICPALGNKGTTVKYLLAEYHWPDAVLAYLGDDDKDEDAFRVIEEHGGVSIRVGPGMEGSQADCFLDDPKATRSWLDSFIKRRENERIL